MLQKRFHFHDGTGPLPDALRGAVVAIGNFDGFHRGHQTILRIARETARRSGAPLVALSFEPHPRDFFARGEPLMRLTDTGSKCRLARAIGLDGLVVLLFDDALSDVSPLDFVRNVLVEYLSCSAVVVGANFRFGAGRAGDVELLARYGPDHGFAVQGVSLHLDAGEAVSSTRIRRELARGNIGAANELLGFRWFVEVNDAIEVEFAGSTTYRFGLRHDRLERLPAGLYAVRGDYETWPFEGRAWLNGTSTGVIEAQMFCGGTATSKGRIAMAFLERMDVTDRADVDHTRIGHDIDLSALDKRLGVV